MSELVFECPKCQHTLRVLSESAGQIVQCPHCLQPLSIPIEAFAKDQSLEAEIPSPPGSSPSAIEDVVITPSDAKSNRQKSSGRSSAPSTPSTADEPLDTDPAKATQTDPALAEATDEAALEPGKNGSPHTPQPIDHLLPPQFLTFDPNRVRLRQQTDNTVVLPTADGGVQAVDQRLVTVEYKGVKYTLVAMTPAQKRRRQLIMNVVSVVIAIIAIAATIWALVNF